MPPLDFVRLVRLAACVGLACALPATAVAERIQGSGVTKTETRAASGFRKIALGVGADLELRQGTGEGVTLIGDDNVLPLVETVVEGGTLKIRWASSRSEASFRSLRVIVDARDIDEITAGGSGNVHAERLKSANLKVTMGGSGRLAIDALEATTVALTMAGSGEAKLAGRADALDATLAGSGDLAAQKLAARVARVTLQGSGRAAVWASERLDATVAGSGEVVYQGKPVVNRTVLGSGSIRAATP